MLPIRRNTDLAPPPEGIAFPMGEKKPYRCVKFRLMVKIAFWLYVAEYIIFSIAKAFIV